MMYIVTAKITYNNIFVLFLVRKQAVQQHVTKSADLSQLQRHLVLAS